MSQPGRMPVVFFGHGSPVNAIDDNAMTRAWAALVAALPRPRSILAVSAHWETQGTAVTAMARPRTIHDFGRSLPAPLFSVEYPAPGNPELARRVAELLSPRPVLLDESWGLDHGTWSVLVKAYPEADIPVVQLSLDVALAPAERLAIGRALAPLRDEGVLIMGSGNIVHNLPAMNWSERACAPYDWSVRFLSEIRDAVLKDEPGRAAAFAGLGEDARRAAPTPEHFWPLLYVLGARLPGDTVKILTDVIEHGSLAMTSLVFGERAPALTAA
jgi:4,5-DOPA dioxygenase extradiol